MYIHLRPWYAIHRHWNIFLAILNRHSYKYDASKISNEKGPCHFTVCEPNFGYLFSRFPFLWYLGFPWADNPHWQMWSAAYSVVYSCHCLSGKPGLNVLFTLPQIMSWSSQLPQMVNWFTEIGNWELLSSSPNLKLKTLKHW